MRAIVVRSFGAPDVLRVEDVPDPRPGEGELLVEVVAAGVNPVDTGIRADGSWAGIELPYTPGSDASGIVRQVGVGVDGFAPGDEVFYFSDFLGTRGGSYAELQVVPAMLTAHKPARLSHVAAAAVPLAAGTAYEVIVRRLDVQPGERVLIVGASGGVGGFATQLAVDRGARVIGVASAANHAYLHELGAEEVLDYRDGDLTERVGEVDALADLYGGDTVASLLHAVRPHGRVATVQSFRGDLDPAIDRNLTLHGVLVRPDGERLAELARLLEEGRLRVTVRSEYPLEQAAAAHREVEAGGAPGKTVIRTASARRG